MLSGAARDLDGCRVDKSCMATAKKVGYAVVGLGRIAERAVLPAFRHSQRAKLIAVVSGQEKKAAKFAAQFGASDYYTYEDYALCLSHPEVEAVFIATTNSTHADFTLRAAAAGKHVLCEKPMATTVGDCARMIEACRTAKVRLMIAYRKYLEPGSRTLKKLVRSGKLGRLKIIHSAFTIMLPAAGNAPAWHLDRTAAGGGSLMDLGVYCVNTSRWLAGTEPMEARAYAWTLDPNRFSEVEESIAFQLLFPGGLVVQASSSFGAAEASFIQLHGEKGWAALDPAFAYNQERRLFGALGGRWFEERFKVMDEFALELDELADCIRRHREPEPSGREGLRDVAVMEAIYRAAREARPVPIPTSAQ
jgi:predicted dehydrogenase